MCATLADSEPAIDSDISTIDVASQILDKHADRMCNLFWLSKRAGWNQLLVPVNSSQFLPEPMVTKRHVTYSSLTFASPHAFLPRAVQTGPGLTLFVVIPLGAHSRAMLLVSPSKPALLAQYAAC